MSKQDGYVPLWKVTLFFLLSAGLYIFPWYYKTRNYLMEQRGTPKNSFISTIFLAFPIVNMVFLYDQQDLINEFLENKKKSVELRPPVVVGLILMIGFLTALVPYLFFMAFIIPFVMQRELNKGTAKKEYWPITIGEVIALFLGILVWIAILT